VLTTQHLSTTKVATNFANKGGRLQTKATEFSLVLVAATWCTCDGVMSETLTRYKCTPDCSCSQSSNDCVCESTVAWAVIFFHLKSVCLGAWPLDTRYQYFFLSTEHLQLQPLNNILSDERMSLSCTIAAGLCQCSHSWV
jgi:hypothetical protein